MSYGLQIKFCIKHLLNKEKQSFDKKAPKNQRRKNCPYLELLWSAFFTHFPAFGLNTGRYVSLNIQSECRKMRKNADQNHAEYGHFLRSVCQMLVIC